MPAVSDRRHGSRRRMTPTVCAPAATARRQRDGGAGQRDAPGLADLLLQQLGRAADAAVHFRPVPDRLLRVRHLHQRRGDRAETISRSVGREQQLEKRKAGFGRGDVCVTSSPSELRRLQRRRRSTCGISAAADARS